MNKKKINYQSFILGLVLNILVIIVFILLYHAYIVEPRINLPQEINLESEEELLE